MGRKGAPPVAESSDRSGWAGTCLCTNEVQGKGLVPTRKSAPLQAVIFREEVLVIARRGRSACTRAAKGRPYGAPSNFAVIARAVRLVALLLSLSLRGGRRPTWQSVLPEVGFCLALPTRGTDCRGPFGASQ